MEAPAPVGEKAAHTTGGDNEDAGEVKEDSNMPDVDGAFKDQVKAVIAAEMEGREDHEDASAPTYLSVRNSLQQSGRLQQNFTCRCPIMPFLYRCICIKEGGTCSSRSISGASSEELCKVAPEATGGRERQI